MYFRKMVVFFEKLWYTFYKYITLLNNSGITSFEKLSLKEDEGIDLLNHQIISLKEYMKDLKVN